ncbi:hypothetical protein RUND412_009184 [Rhizina undulata]
MAETKHLPTGAYVIQPHGTLSVIRLDEEESKPAKLAAYDVHKYRDHQIWWVENLPHDEDDPDADDKGRVYTITNIAKNKSLHLLDGSSESGISVYAIQSSGLPWQKWRIRLVKNIDSGSDYYTVTNLHSNTALDFNSTISKNISPSGTCDCRTPSASAEEQRWAFTLPLVAVPSGWIQIQNVETGRFLQHNYLSLPPFLAKNPVPLKPTYYRATWGLQWAFVYPLEHKENNPQNLWLIKNRLTGGLLECRAASDDHKTANVHASEFKLTNLDYRQWWVEISPSEGWKIKSREV